MDLKIGEIAKKAKVNIQTVRYYEKRGLLLPQSRMESGYRLYDKGAEKRLEFILYAKELGFTLEEIKGLMQLKARKTARCGDVKIRAEKKINEIDKKIKGLRSMKKVLEEMVRICQNGQPMEKCSILKAIEKGGE